jgi:hypothetical protein
MSAANPNPIEKSMVSVLVVVNAGGGSLLMSCVYIGYLWGWSSLAFCGHSIGANSVIQFHTWVYEFLEVL